MTGRLVHLLTPLPLLLCAALWPFSYFYDDVVGCWPAPARGRLYALVSIHGTLCLVGATEGNGRTHFAWRHMRDEGLPPRLGTVMGFIARRDGQDWIVGLPFWALCTASAAPPLVRLARLRRRRPGECPHCRYNLTGNTSGVCPECGTPASATSVSPT